MTLPRREDVITMTSQLDVLFMTGDIH